MTNKDAISQLSELIGDRKSFIEGDTEHDEIYRKDIEALRKGIRALEHRTPKKPARDGIFNGWFCPTCGVKQRPKNKSIAYCTWCGQAIDWKEVSS